ncbi:MAG: hypothetical protein M9887_02635 [Chitinophagales bacterium]|nr:hypothetical protein [Chitinophagales bacterium]
MKNISLIMLVIACIFTISCKKEKHNADCGCNAPTRVTIEDTQALVGKVYYSVQQIANGYLFQNKFFIKYNEQNCSNCNHYMIICNESILPQQILNIKNDTSQLFSVKFAGHLKPICDKVFAPADYTYENILLTKIEVQ